MVYYFENILQLEHRRNHAIKLQMIQVAFKRIVYAIQ